MGNVRSKLAKRSYRVGWVEVFDMCEINAPREGKNYHRNAILYLEFIGRSGPNRRNHSITLGNREQIALASGRQFQRRQKHDPCR